MITNQEYTNQMTSISKRRPMQFEFKKTSTSYETPLQCVKTGVAKWRNWFAQELEDKWIVCALGVLRKVYIRPAVLVAVANETFPEYKYNPSLCLCTGDQNSPQQIFSMLILVQGMQNSTNWRNWVVQELDQGYIVYVLEMLLDAVHLCTGD